ncbi:MAG TPA: FCD domain-containing protein [Pseudonocardiaceae bacterium]|nr:FCD domain-containing protein [Pseudonocardiaceae bacterium]
MTTGEPAATSLGALRPLGNETAGARIAARFVTAIALGQFVPDQKLPNVRELATLLEVSPTTVREALGRLSALGYVTVKRGRAGGTFVTSHWGPESDAMVRSALEPEWARLESLLDFRSLVEQQIARTAAQRSTKQDARRIKAALLAYERAGADRESSRQADLEVHQAIAVATRNPHLVDLSLRIRHDVSLGFEAEPYSAPVRERALHQHPQLADAVIEHQPQRAARLAAEHFSLTEQTLRDLHDRVLGIDRTAGKSRRNG